MMVILHEKNNCASVEKLLRFNRFKSRCHIIVKKKTPKKYIIIFYNILLHATAAEKEIYCLLLLLKLLKYVLCKL